MLKLCLHLIPARLFCLFSLSVSPSSSLFSSLFLFTYFSLFLPKFPLMILRLCALYGFLALLAYLTWMSPGFQWDTLPPCSAPVKCHQLDSFLHPTRGGKILSFCLANRIPVSPLLCQSDSQSRRLYCSYVRGKD